MNANTTAALIHRTKTGTDEFGAPVYSETTTILDGIYYPAGSSESTAAQEQVTWQDTLCLPASAAALAIDAVIPQATVDAGGNATGEQFEVNGQPTVWPANPFTGNQPAFPVVLQLTRVTG